jgi:beta-phosphoglucomutase
MLKENGIRIALGSASKNAALIIKNLKLADYFEAIVDGNSVSKAKPDPEVFLLAAEELGIEPQYCVVFEDAKAGVEAAKNAGMLCIGVGSMNILGEADAVIPGFEGLSMDVFDFGQEVNFA